MSGYCHSTMFSILDDTVCFTTDIARGNGLLQKAPIDQLLTAKGLFLPFSNYGLAVVDYLNGQQLDDELDEFQETALGILITGDAKVYEITTKDTLKPRFNRVLYGTGSYYVRSGYHEMEVAALVAKSSFIVKKGEALHPLAMHRSVAHVQVVPKATYWQMPMAELAAGIASRKILSPSFWKKIKHIDLGEYK